MCTLAVFRNVSAAWPLVVAANRDEFFGRASAPPSRSGALLLAGRDLVAGGTWLGCRTDGSGRVAALLNRRPSPDLPATGPGARSRGLLCLEALEAPSIAATVEALDGEAVGLYGGFNLFLADLGEALVVDNGMGDEPRVHALPDGLSVLTNLDVNDPRCARQRGAAEGFCSLVPRLQGGLPLHEAADLLAAVLAGHDPAPGSTDSGRDALDRVCVHTPRYGTRSATLLFVDAEGGVRCFHADGAPCSTPFREVLQAGLGDVGEGS